MNRTLRISLGRADAFRDFPAPIRIGSRTYFLVRDDSGLRLFSTVCPHQGGAVFDEGSRFECPIHGWRFDRATGQCLNAPGKALSASVVTVEEGVLWADLPDRPDEASAAPTPRRGRATKPGLTMRLHAHACLEISCDSFTLLTDPWLDGPAFFGAWAHYPPPAVHAADLKPDAILITHEHSDHFHEPTLIGFDRRTPVFVPDFPNQRMTQRLTALGFSNVRPLRFGEAQEPRAGWRMTAFEPQSYWNDAFCLVEIDGFRILNLNDGGVNARIAGIVAPVDVIAMQFSGGASSYPWTWDHITDDEKVAISERACEGKFRLMRDAAALYSAASVLPFASHFTLWHPSHREYARIMKRNRVSDAKAVLGASGIDVIDILPGDEWNGGNGMIRRASGDPALYSADRLSTYIDSPRHAAAFVERHPPDETLSATELVDYLDRLNDVPQIATCEPVTVRLQGEAAQPGGTALDVSFAIADGALTILSAAPAIANLHIRVPLGVLTAIVRQGISWDEAFIGYWCRFDRHPNVYHASFWRLLQAPYFNRPGDDLAVAPGIIDARSTVAELLETHGPDADRVLRRYGLYCSGCQHSTSDSIGMAARQHGLEAERVAHLLAELNATFADVLPRV